MDKTLFIEKRSGKEKMRVKFSASLLLYYFAIACFIAIMVSSVSFAKFSSTISSNVTSDVAALRIQFDDGGTGTIELSDWTPGDQETFNFNVMNFDSQNRLVEFAIKYRIVIETASLIDLNFVLSQKVNGSWTTVALSQYVDSESSFTILYGEDCTLPHSVAKTDEFRLVVSWPNSSDNENLLTTDGEYIKVGLDWQQDIA
ncbi:MAG: hypothetical protein IJS68_03540 [Clostridia bacterium]|nr:hypothetical protein [Clostridia bacterium]